MKQVINVPEGYSIIIPQEEYDAMKLEIDNLRERTGFGKLEEELSSLRKKNDLIKEKIESYKNQTFFSKYLFENPIKDIEYETNAFTKSLSLVSKNKKNEFTHIIQFHLNKMERLNHFGREFIDILLNIINE